MNSDDFEKGWMKVEGFINRDMADLMYGYVLLAKRRLEVIQEDSRNNTKFAMVDDRVELYKQLEKNIWGTFEDDQALGDYSRYGDLIFDTLLIGKNKLTYAFNNCTS